MKCNDVEVSITVNDTALEEYKEEKEQENALTSWIASAEGQDFKIKIDNQMSGHLNANIEIDGRPMEQMLVRGKSSGHADGVYINATTIRTFTFTRINISDDDSLLEQDCSNLEAVGTIKVTIQRVTRRAGQSKTHPTTFTNIPDIGVVHERKKKAGVHCVSLGREERKKPYCSVFVEYIDPKHQPLCVFIYRYRAKEILQAQGIVPLSALIPTSQNAGSSQDTPQSSQRTASGSGKRQRERSPSSGPRLKEESQEPSDDEDVDALKAQVEALQARITKRSDRGRHKHVKREPSPIRLQTSGDVIDLTLD